MPAFDLIPTAILIGVVVAFVMGTVAYLILAERKVSAWVQDRVGPNRVGPAGLLQPIADGGKMFLKEDIIPAHVDKVFYLLAPAAAFATAMLAIAVVPFGGTAAPPPPAVSLAEFEQAQADYRNQFSFAINPGLDVGILYVFAVGSLAVYGIILGGWSANSKYSLLGALRSSAQIISYEIPLGMSVVGVFLVVGSLNLEAIIDWQKQHTWFVFFQPLAFLLFMTSVYAECNRLPFDLPEAEQELVGGYHTEYSSLKFGMFFLGEYTHMITTSFLMAILFWGGWSLFGVEDLAGGTAGAVIKLAILLGKMGLFIFLYLLVRWTIPRFRFDQLMNLAWKVMMPLGLAHLLGVMLILQFVPPDANPLSARPGWWLPGGLMLVMSVGLFVAAGYLSAKWRASVTVPKRAVRKLPPGLPAGVTYAGR